MVDKKVLYQACKYEVNNFQEDCGMDLPTMWKVVNGKNLDEIFKGCKEDLDGGYVSYRIFWFNTVLEDYVNRG